MIHRALKLLRVYHNLKQKELAPRLGISPSHLSELESGVKGVSYEILEKYAEVFRIPVSSIALFAEAAASPDKSSILGQIPEKALRLLEWLNTITEVTNQDDDKQAA
jgi:transcriptional regulator with XRE-family HTH domain